MGVGQAEWLNILCKLVGRVFQAAQKHGIVNQWAGSHAAWMAIAFQPKSLLRNGRLFCVERWVRVAPRFDKPTFRALKFVLGVPSIVGVQHCWNARHRPFYKIAMADGSTHVYPHLELGARTLLGTKGIATRSSWP